MVSFRDSVATDSTGHWPAPALESTSRFRRGSVVAGWGQCDSRWNFVSSSLSAYLDKRNRFSEELGARPRPVCRFADLEDSAMDPRPDRRGNRWNLFVTTCPNPKRSKSLYQPMDKTLFNLLNTGAPAATLVVRLLAGLVFFAEGIKKFMFPTEWGIGRFEKIGIIYPNLSAPFVGVVETVCGLLLIFGLFTRPAALLLLINISVAILTTKVPLALHKGFWPAEAEARADYSMFMSSLFLLFVGAGSMSLDAWWSRKRNDLSKQRRMSG
jgi:putative oxidoreductase